MKRLGMEIDSGDWNHLTQTVAGKVVCVLLKNCLRRNALRVIFRTWKLLFRPGPVFPMKSVLRFLNWFGMLRSEQMGFERTSCPPGW